MSLRRLLGIVALAAVVASCTSDAPTSQPPAEAVEPNGGPNDLLEFPDTDIGVLSSYSFPESHELVEEDPAKGTIEAELLACRWEWPGRLAYDIRWEPPDDLDLPATVSLEILRIFRGDMSVATRVDAVLDAPGAFTLVVNEHQLSKAGRRRTQPDEPTTWDSQDGLRGIGDSCSLAIESEHPTEIAEPEDDLRVEQAGVRPIVNAPAGTVEQLLALVDPGDPDDPLMPLAALFDDPTWPPIDRLWIAPTERLESISITAEGTCVHVATRYAKGVFLTQQRGCEVSTPDQDADPVIGVEDDVWDVRLTGSRAAIDALVEGLAVVPFADGGSGEVAPFDPDSYLDAWYDQRPDLLEVGRAPWRDGAVSAWIDPSRSTDEIHFQTELVAPTEVDGPPTPPTSVVGGTTCQDFATWIKSSSGGILVVVTTEDVDRAEYLVQDWTEIPLADGADGYRFGVVEGWDDDLESSSTPQTRFFDADGAEIACEQ